MADQYTPSGVPVLRGINVNRGRFHDDDFVFIDEETADRLSKFESYPGDVLLVHKGTLGPIGLMPRIRKYGRYIMGNSMLRVRCDATKLLPEYLYYWLSSADGQHYLFSRVSQVGVPQLQTPLSTLRQASLPVPPIREQRAIAHILGTLDDKIELNRRMNETLERQARALFKSWFVDFDPVRAKAEGLIREGVLEIGDGYRAKNSELGEKGLPFIRAGNLNDGFDTAGADLLREESVAKAGSKVCRVGDVAFTSKGTIGRFGRVTQHTAQFVYSPQVCYWRSLDPSRLHPVILYCWMQSDDLGEQLAAVAGQTDMAPYVSLQDQRQMTMPIFPPSQHTLARRIEPLLARQSSNTAEAKTLAALRDTLLPKLISGELRVKNADRLVAEATA